MKLSKSYRIQQNDGHGNISIYYSEEYWLYKNNLMPKEMWTKRIDNGVQVNLKTYPALIKGYFYWRDKGAFNHPAEFRQLVESKIKKIRQQ